MYTPRLSVVAIRTDQVSCDAPWFHWVTSFVQLKPLLVFFNIPQDNLSIGAPTHDDIRVGRVELETANSVRCLKKQLRVNRINEAPN